MGVISFGSRRLGAHVRDIAYRIKPTTHREITVRDTTASFRLGTDTERVAIGHISKEEDTIRDVLNVASADDCFLDIGANIGQFAAFVGQHVETHSVEPYPPSFTTLEYNFERNNCTGHVYNRAVSSQDTVNLSVPILPKPGWQTPSADGFGRPLTVEGITGEDLMKQVPTTPTIMKIDVEGAEDDVLGSFDDLTHFHTIYVEVHEPHWRRGDTDQSRVDDLLLRAGFEIEELEDRGRESLLKATR